MAEQSKARQVHNEFSQQTAKAGRRDFVKRVSAITIGAIASPGVGYSHHLRKIMNSLSVKKGKAKIATILHTADIHAQLYTHDEFFVENGQVLYKKRGGFAVLKTLLNAIRSENPENTVLIDGGDCFQGGGLAALTQGRAMVPVMNDIGYDLVIPGNWEVVYGKEMMMKDLGGYNAQKVCANMFHQTDDSLNGDLIFKPYWTKVVAGIKIGFIGYTDPNIPKRQPPAFSKGIQFTKPIENVARYVGILKDDEQCARIFLVTHMGLAQEVNFANQPEVQGVHHIFGADTHERVRNPVKGKYATVSEPGAFGSFVSRFDMIVEDGKIKDETYQLIDVDPEKFKPDRAMVLPTVRSWIK